MSDAPAGVDLDALARWAADTLPALTPPFTGHTLVGGQSNITVRIDDATGQSVVLRRPPLHGVLATAHDMGREHRIISALVPTPVPVPVTMAMCHDTDVIGAPFYVMSYVEGVVLETADDVVEASMTADARRAAWILRAVAYHGGSGQTSNDPGAAGSLRPGRGERRPAHGIARPHLPETIRLRRPASA